MKRNPLLFFSIIFCLSGCAKFLEDERRTYPPIYLKSDFWVVARIEECPGSWMLERLDTGDQFTTDSLPAVLQIVGKVFNADCKMTLRPGERSGCLRFFSQGQIKVARIWRL